MFWLTLVVTIVTYPFVFAGSIILLFALLTAMYDTGENPFVSPKTVYKFYKKSFTGWKDGLVKWYEDEKEK